MIINAVKINQNIESDLFNELLQYIDHQKKIRISKIMRREVACRVLLAEIISRTTANDVLNIKNNKISFKENIYGKPFLQNFSSYHFNLSHSGLWLVCGAADSEIGIDVEYVRKIDFKIAKRFFSNKEYDDLMKKPENKRLEFFYDLWTLKESYLKAVGKGLMIPLDSFRFEINDDGINFYNKDNNNDFSFKQYIIDTNYKLSVCLKNAKVSFPDDIKIIKYEALIKKFKMMTK